MFVFSGPQIWPQYISIDSIESILAQCMYGKITLKICDTKTVHNVDDVIGIKLDSSTNRVFGTQFIESRCTSTYYITEHTKLAFYL